MSLWPVWIAAGFEEELPGSLDGRMSPQPAWMTTGREVDLHWSLVWLMSPLSSLTAAGPKRESNVSKFFFTSARGVYKAWLHCGGPLWILMGLFNFGRAFLGHARLFLTLPDSIGIVTGFFDKLGLLDVGDSTGNGLLDSTETAGSTGTMIREFDCLGFL